MLQYTCYNILRQHAAGEPLSCWRRRGAFLVWIFPQACTFPQLWGGENVYSPTSGRKFGRLRIKPFDLAKLSISLDFSKVTAVLLA